MPLCQAGIVQCGGLRPLLELLESSHYNLQHNAAFALYGLSDNEDNVGNIVREGGMQCLLECSERLQVQASKVGGCLPTTVGRSRVLGSAWSLNKHNQNYFGG